ncbi:Maf-like protein YhdE [Enhygromyxa salina]|uniref:dTTP/UTP pyrophosphatase n=1 Tax=Enhygromyxa salina TaxID=215803 RepID=A0A2S9XDM1_9BACT|nr:Maf family protein [Enhygromyxa salina]PRP90860.1 Maf-like protein YhdE [Enhygromyxa salina]
MLPPALVLASASPRRAELLRSAGLSFTVRPVDCDESWRPGEAPIAYVERVAALKAAAAAALAELPAAALILAADTTVWLDEDREPLAKPRDRAHAAAMLRELTRGRAHRVSTACALARPRSSPPVVERLVETSIVRMRALSDAQFAAFIDPYLDAAQWSDKAGAYAIQGRAAGLVEAIEGSYTGIVGLPLAQVLTMLEAHRDQHSHD